MVFSLRAPSTNDDEFLLQVYSSTRADEMAMVPWDQGQKRAFLEMQFKAQRQAYLDEFPEAEYHIILREGVSAGRLIVDRNGQRILLVDIALLPDHRSQGIGSRLISELKAEAEKSGKPLWLDVENFNPVRLFYERIGFRKIDEIGLYWRLEWRPSSEAAAV
jgi:ribosomal protein S18 acetylase RimI-like enzyme